MLDDDCLPDLATVPDPASESSDDSVYVVDDESANGRCAVAVKQCGAVEQHPGCVSGDFSVCRSRSQRTSGTIREETTADAASPLGPITNRLTKPSKDQQRCARLAERQKKAHEKEMDKLLKQAMKEQRKAARPGECDKHMVIECDHALLTTELGNAIRSLADLAQIGCDFRQHTMLNTILFKRRRMDYGVNTVTGMVQDVIKHVSLTTEGVAVVLATTDFLSLVKSFIGERNGTIPAKGAVISLKEYASRVRSAFCLQPTIIVIGCDSYFRGTSSKAKKRRPTAGLVDSSDGRSRHDQQQITDVYTVTRMDVEECCVDLQLTSNICVIHCDSIAEAAQIVLHLNKAVAETPFKREKLAALAADDGVCAARVHKDGAGLILIWKKMLQEFRNVSPDVAEAIIEAYPSPHSLCEAYKHCSNTNEAVALLEDLQVRRGTGALQTIRRVGKELSRRVYQLFCSTDPSFVIL